MKLYVWEGVLVSYTAGLIVAFAETVEEARLAVVRKQYTDSLGTIPKYSEEAYRQWIVNGRPSDDSNGVWSAIQDEPDVYETPIGFIEWGGD